MKYIPTMKLAAVIVLTSLLGSLSPSSAQVLVGFEGANPFQSPTGTNPSVTLVRAGDTGAVTSSNLNFNLPAPQGSQYAVLTTFSNGGGTYPPGAPLFGGNGAITSAALWNTMFPGSANNQLNGLSIVTGSSITFSLTLAVGNMISVNWRFLTSEPATGGNPDRAFVGVRQGNTGNPQLFQTLSQAGPGLISSPTAFFNVMNPAVGTFAFLATTAGAYTFAFGVGDAGTEGTQSGLILDNFVFSPIPEPGTVSLLVGAGLVGMIFYRRRMYFAMK
ncbi:MAG: PEP-CTERM sorting domain-containing protein [Nitrospirota bacterium]